MRASICSALLTLAVFLLNGLALAQQYVGDVIPNSLPGVPGSEITYFRINDPSGKNNNLTLTNYYTHQLNGQRIVESQIMRAVVVIHGLNRDPGTYASNMMSALSQVTSDPNVNRSTVAIMAPYFPNGDDKNYGYPWTNGLAAGRGSTTNALVWPGSQWSAGGNNQYPYTSKNTSSYTVLDQIIQYFDNPTLFPNMKQIVIAGHSLGGQTVQRYAAIGQPGSTRSPVSYWVANPDSYVWFSTSRPLSTASCPIYDVYREGYTNFTQYPMTYGLSLVNSGRSNILANFNSKSINYARGTQDLGDDASSCAPETTGANRNERFFNFIAAFPPSCSGPAARNCDTVDFVNVGHDGSAMMASPAGQARLFLDNFYGNGNRSYDFGYPRQQAGDDPYPNPALNSTAASTNNNTYAGNMTYWGCWSDQNPPTLTNLSYTSNTNTIETCISTCVQGGNTIAGLEFGTQCFCGSSLGYEATEVIDSSCGTPCPGSSSEICGGGNRLSLYSKGRPAVQSTPGTPETVDGSYYIGCYTEATTGRALSGNSASGPFMTLEYCGNFCSGYQYFGTEYADECYCGNQFAAGANITSDNDCSMLCANNTAEFCGAGNRLTVYQNTSWVAPSSGSTTSSVASSTSSSGSSSTGAVCPGSNNTVVTSNSKNFTIECGIDHQGGDLTSLSVGSFQGCIDACAQSSQCVDVSLSGSACYLKSTLGAAVTNAGISGAKLVASASSTSTTASSTQSSVSGSQTNTASTSPSTNTASSASTSSASTTATPVTCPGSNSTTFTANNGETFFIECGIDHFAGDMSSLSVNSFADCINACATTNGCVDVSLSGSACYLKSSVGVAVQNGVWGARLVNSSSTSTASSGTQPTASVSTSIPGSTSVPTTSSTIFSSLSSTTSQSASVFATSSNTLLSSTSGSQSSSAPSSSAQNSVSSLKSSTESSSITSTLPPASSSGSTTRSQTASSQAITPSSSLTTIASGTSTDILSNSQSSSLSGTVSTSISGSSPPSVSTSIASATISSLSGSSPAASSTISSTTLTASTPPSSPSGSTPLSLLSTLSTSVQIGSSSSAPTETSNSGSTTSQSASSPPGSSSTLLTITLASSPSNGGVVQTTLSTSTSSISGGSGSAPSSPISTESTIPSSSDLTSTKSGTSVASGSISDSTGSTSPTASSLSSASDTISSLSSPPVPTSTLSQSTQSPTTLSTSTLSSSSATSDQQTATSESTSSSSLIASLSSSSSLTSSQQSSDATASTSSGLTSSIQSSTSSQTASTVTSTASLLSSTDSQTISSTSPSSSSSGSSSILALSTISNTSGVSSQTSASSQTTSSAQSATSTSTPSPSTMSTSTLKSSSTTSSSSSTVTTVSPSLSSGFSSVGCYVDSTSSRALPHSNGTSIKQTPQQCALNCRTLGYKYSGTEYASECWCGNTQPATTAAASTCNSKCSGDKTQICGAGNRLSVVVDTPWKQTFFAAPSYKTWNLMACYVDSTSSRLLSHSVSLSAYGGGSNATIGNCMDACTAKGYVYCGEEYYSECYGSNSAPPASAVASGADPLSAGCSYPCKGNATEACGGSNRILVYTNNGTAT